MKPCSYSLKPALFEKYWRDTRCFQSENIYTPAIKTLLDKLDVKLREGDTIPVEYRIAALEDFFRVVAGERPAKEEVSFSSDKEGNYYFNGRKVKVENSDEYAYRLLKTKIQTSYRRPVDFTSASLPVSDHTELMATCITRVSRT